MVFLMLFHYQDPKSARPRCKRLPKSQMLFLICLVSACALCPSLLNSSLIAGEISIAGWPHPEISNEKADLWLGNDPVIGRLACPPLTRVNLEKKKSEPLILKNVSEQQIGGQHLWNLELRSGIYWWNQKEVTADDIAHFIRNNLLDVAYKKSGGLWNVPKFEIKTSALTLKIIWKEKPPFGPYVFNGVSLYKKTESFSRGVFRFQCAGVYNFEKTTDGLSLNPSKAYKQSLPKLALKQGQKADIAFLLAGTKPASIDRRPPDKPFDCKRKVSLPFLTVIRWNLKSKLLSSKAFRQLMTALTPRGALLRFGSGFLGDLVSAPILRHHPGYDKSIKVRSFDFDEVIERLNELGFDKRDAAGFRLSLAGEPVKIKISKSSKEEHWIEKILIDSAKTVGLNLEIGSEGAVDGRLSGIFINWPDLNYLPDFHSLSKMRGDRLSHTNKKLDLALMSYAKSLSSQTPDFDLLKKVHGELYDLELMSVLVHHYACMTVNRSLSKKVSGSVNTLDPDWFREIILGLR